MHFFVYYLNREGPEKKDQSLRICLDFRDLNKQTIFDPVLMPRMDEVLNKVSKARYISKLDLTKGYWQVPLEPF
jgi:hypothetical protein